MNDNPKLKKNGGPGTGAGNFLRSLTGGKILPTLLDAVGVGDFARAIGIVSNDKDNAGLTVDQAAQFFSLAELDIKDLQHARNMQVTIATSEHSTPLAKNFVYYLSTGIFVFSCVIIVMLFFIEVPDKNRDIVNFILGVLIGNGLAQMIQYFLGSTKSSKEKTGLMALLGNKK